MCTKCNVSKELVDYYPSNGTLQTQCKQCTKQRMKLYREANPVKIKESWKRSGYATKYGITLEQYNEMFALQAGSCAICKKHQSELQKALAVDHCHTTQMIRGLLCSTCNIGLGYFQDSETSLLAAIEYLKQSKMPKGQ